ncbi:DUF4232 domain-containing protein [Bordetella flabilis]|nr:DUF4232 domain-containing protein [Bordetella flabilis]
MKYASWSYPRAGLAAALLCCMLPHASAGTSPAPAAGLANPTPACGPAQLSFKADAKNGEFDGMSHSGTLLVLRNRGPVACTVPARPELTFLDGGGRPVLVSPRTAPGMHPGPVLLPVTVPAGAELTSVARWVSSDAYGANNCVAFESVAISLGGRMLTASLGREGHMCGPARQNPGYTVSPLGRGSGETSPGQ